MDRRKHLKEDQARQEYNQQAAANAQDLKYILRSLYLPEEGMFCQMPKNLTLGKKIEVCSPYSNTTTRLTAL